MSCSLSIAILGGPIALYSTAAAETGHANATLGTFAGPRRVLTASVSLTGHHDRGPLRCPRSFVF